MAAPAAGLGALAAIWGGISGIGQGLGTAIAGFWQGVGEAAKAPDGTIKIRGKKTELEFNPANAAMGAAALVGTYGLFRLVNHTFGAPKLPKFLDELPDFPVIGPVGPARPPVVPPPWPPSAPPVVPPTGPVAPPPPATLPPSDYYAPPIAPPSPTGPVDFLPPATRSPTGLGPHRFTPPPPITGPTSPPFLPPPFIGPPKDDKKPPQPPQLPPASGPVIDVQARRAERQDERAARDGAVHSVPVASSAPRSLTPNAPTHTAAPVLAPGSSSPPIGISTIVAPIAIAGGALAAAAAAAAVPAAATIAAGAAAIVAGPAGAAAARSPPPASPPPRLTSWEKKAERAWER